MSESKGGVFDGLLGTLRGQATDEMESVINGVLPVGVTFSAKPNPAEDHEDEGDGDDGSGEVEVGAIAFENKGSGDNLAGAAAAYRMVGTKDDLIAQHKGTGYAFFGSPDELQEYREQTDRLEGWDEWTVADEILALDYDEETMGELLDLLHGEADGIGEAEAQYEGFHWGDKPTFTGVKQVPGIHAPLTFLGTGRRLDYYAKKEGEPAEYYHHFGEKTGEYPSVYALGTDCLVIHGANMEITDRGVVE